MSISPWSGARGLQRLIFLKYYNTLKWESRFTLGLNTAKNMHYIKKISKNASNESCLELNFIHKNQWAQMSITSRYGARSSEDCHFRNIIMY